MSIQTLILSTAVVALTAFATPDIAFAAPPATPDQGTVTQAFQYAITNAPGKTMTAVIVNYPPGAKSAPHRHGSAFVVGYVLSGAIRSKVNKQKERVYHAGESFTENPGDHHEVSANASDTEPAKLLAIFVADSSDHKLTIWDKK